MLDELDLPPYEYVPLAPFMVTFEWWLGRADTFCHDALDRAVVAWIDGAATDDSPTCAILIDARGRTILGVLARPFKRQQFCMVEAVHDVVVALSSPRALEWLERMEMVARGCRVEAEIEKGR